MELEQHLRLAYQACQERSLLFAAKWVAELLTGMGRGKPNVDENLLLCPPPLPETSASAEPTSEGELDTIRLGKALMDIKEFRSAANALRECHSKTALFVRLYALFLVEDQSNAYSVNMSLDSTLNTKRPEFEQLSRELDAACSLHKGDGFLLYLYGVVLAKRKLKKQALSVMIRSVCCYPYNWSAWMELSKLVEDVQIFAIVDSEVPPSFMKTFFLVHVATEMHIFEQEECLSYIDNLDKLFPSSKFLMAQRGIALYNYRKFDAAERLLENVHCRDPDSVEYMDVYSNILFVNDSCAKLSALAHTCTRVDQFRPETCCVVGNYFSLKGEHEKAVVYFQRSLQLNRNYLSAWTLMGHEYLEMGATNAALEAYRRAIDVNPRDYRAWFGLGQTYEMLRMPFYAIYYFQKATVLRPHDSRMWNALASVYEAIQRDYDAIRCYERGLSQPLSMLVDSTAEESSTTNEDALTAQETATVLHIGKLQEKLHSREAALATYQIALHHTVKASREFSAESARAALYVAKHYRQIGDRKGAETLLMRLIECTGPEREEAKLLLHELKDVANIY